MSDHGCGTFPVCHREALGVETMKVVCSMCVACVA